MALFPGGCAQVNPTIRAMQGTTTGQHLPGQLSPGRSLLTMAHAPLLPLMPSGTLPPVALLLRWLEDLHQDQVDTVVVGTLPQLNASLPDLLRLGGISTVLASGLPRPGFRWEGVGGSRVSVRDAEATVPDDLVHHGQLPSGEAQFADDQGLLGLVEMARLADASSCLGLGDGASWNHILMALDRGRIPRLPHLRGRAPEGDVGLGVWNPLPFARELTCVLPLLGDKPWGVADAQGRTYPIQIVEGSTGEEVLTTLSLGAHECVGLTPVHDPVADATWDVETDVLDNGLVRIELDPLGHIVRLCSRGVFAEFAGPAVAPTINGLPLGGTATITIHEAGPVRARVGVTRTTTAGTLRLTYTVHAHEDVVRIAGTWSGDGDLILTHPTTHRGSLLHAAGDLSRAMIPQARSILHPPAEPLAGVRWATLGDSSGRGLAVAAGRPITLEAEGGVLRIYGAPAVSYALGALGGSRREGLNLGQLANHLAVGGRSFSGSESIPAPFRLANLGGLYPIWSRPPPGWAGEIVFADQSGARGRGYLYPRKQPTEAVRVDVFGNALAPVHLTREGDGLELDHGPCEVFIVRWR